MKEAQRVGSVTNMESIRERITVCICTYQRPGLLLRLLESVAAQETGGGFDVDVVIVDNDCAESARNMVEAFAAASPLSVVYAVEPQTNIALARNKVVSLARGQFLAFIDDDEFVAPGWLRCLHDTVMNYEVAGALGPVLPHFDSEAPRWLVRGGFYDRPRYETGRVMHWRESRTGNVLLRRDILKGLDEVFRPRYGEGGEDQDFFRRMTDAGHLFVWCDEAPAYEAVPPHRWTRRFLLRRALLRGNISFSQGGDRQRNLVKAVIAVPVYALALPFLLLGGQHLFMRYLVRLCDHLGRLLALFRLNPVQQRNH